MVLEESLERVYWRLESITSIILKHFEDSNIIDQEGDKNLPQQHRVWVASICDYENNQISFFKFL